MITRKHSLRFVLIFLGLISCLIVFGIKLILIQSFGSAHLVKLAKKQHNSLIDLEPKRGTIFDRNLRPLAFNVPVFSFFANPRVMSSRDRDQALSVLPGMLGIPREELARKLSERKYFVWIKRKISKDLAMELNKINLNGFGFRKESKRYYPNQNLAAHIIGFAGVDNEGLEGLELFYNKDLRGEQGWMRIIKDARQRQLLISDEIAPPKDGLNLVLTIDETIQFIAEHALEKGFIKNNAKAGSIIVVDVKTGEILALANKPTYNLDNVSQSNLENRTNRALSFVYEPGSIFKIVTAAAALEEGAFKETDRINCENGKYRVASNILHDHTPHGTITFREVIEVSSNIGVTKIAQKLGADKVYKYAHRFRFGQKTGIDLKGEVAGILKHPKVWSKTSIGAIPIGHEVLSTPLQLVCSLAAVANGGVYMKPYIVKYIKDNNDVIIRQFFPQEVDRIISEETAFRLKEILVGVTENGTAKSARIKGIRVAGKTGTSQKVEGKVYSHSRFYASFMGFAPADNPRLAAIVVYDEPHPYYFGGVVSAPVFREVMENSLKYLEAKE
ncbi:MAG: penicillin-binding protein [Candidatus Omnitrophica bacterium]|nr:penicillin-binding protein [Candidatus Omnitrophota bacterium]